MGASGNVFMLGDLKDPWSRTHPISSKPKSLLSLCSIRMF